MIICRAFGLLLWLLGFLLLIPNEKNYCFHFKAGVDLLNYSMNMPECGPGETVYLYIWAYKVQKFASIGISHNLMFFCNY